MQGSKILFLVLVIFCIVVSASSQQSGGRPTQREHFSSNNGLGAKYANVPLMFEANQGQADRAIRYISHGNNYTVYLTDTGMLLKTDIVSGGASAQNHNPPLTTHTPAHTSPIRQLEKTYRGQKSSLIGIDLVGTSARPVIAGEGRLKTRVNYFIGRDPKKWLRDVPVYGQVRYSNVYPGIDLLFYGNNRQIEYDFEVAPGSDPTKIQFSVTGADNIAVNSDGTLILTKAETTLRFQMPFIYQEIDGKRNRIAGNYVLRDTSNVGFTLGEYDSTKSLVIDPVLVYSTYLGGSTDNFGMGVAVDSAGQALVTGITDSPDFPLANIGTNIPSQFRMFVTKFDASGSSLLFANYFGGTTGADSPYAIALDSAGNIYITGSTDSSDFPLVNAYQSNFSGSEDAFLTKFSADGSSIAYSTYLGGATLTDIGGSVSQIGTSVAVDANGEAVVGGFTQAIDFPISNAFQGSVTADQFGNLGQYGFITKFTSDGSALIYSTYLGGSTYNVAACSGCFPSSLIMAVAADTSGNAYVTGWTNTDDFPTTPGSYMSTSAADPLSNIGFVARFTNSGAISYSTYLGGLSSILNGIAVDGTGSAYVTGYASTGDNFPTTSTGICDASTAPCNGTVVAKLDDAGANLVYSTFLGTSNNMTGQAIQVDAAGDAFIVGSDLQFDLVDPIEQYSGNGDIVIAELDPSGNRLVMATFLGGYQLEASADSLAIDKNGALYVTGLTQSPDFPVTPSALESTLTGTSAAFLAKIDTAADGPMVSITPSSLQFGSVDVGSSGQPQVVILRNMSSGSLSITAKNMTGDFSETDDCGSSLLPASRCTFNITFSPTVSGTRSGTLTVSDNAGTGFQVAGLEGHGAGSAPALIVSPSYVNFAPSPVGTPNSAESVTITNPSSTNVTITSIQASTNFAIAENHCATVAAYGSCTLQVTFTARSAGPVNGILQIVLGPDIFGNVTLSGTGTDFVTSTPSSSATVAPGGTASFVISIAPLGGSFASPIQLTCTGTPAFSSCNANPSSIIPGGSSASSTVTVTTSADIAHAGWSERGKQFLVAGILAPSGVFVLLVPMASRRKFRPSSEVLLFLALLVLAGCTGVSSSRTPVSAATAPGTYHLNIVAKSGNLQHLMPVTLVVQ